MAKERLNNDEKNINIPTSKNKSTTRWAKVVANKNLSEFTHLQHQLGNRAVQRLLAQRSGDGPATVDDDTADRINRARGGGQAMDASVQRQMSQAMGADFSEVRVHTSGESHALNQQLGAKAFTTGQDIFFRQGAYNPASNEGQDLLAHELTHVVQQSMGAVSGSGSGMTVNEPGDAFEQEADAVARAVVQSDLGTTVQRQVEEEAVAQGQVVDEEKDELPSEV